MRKNYAGLQINDGKKHGLLLLFCVLVELFYCQQTYTFTPAGASGNTGPTAAHISTAYASTNLNGVVTVAGGVQSWTVPVSGGYRIEAYGAQGGNSSNNNSGGLGAKISGEFNLTAGTVLNIVVGQAGTAGSGAGGGGGGGGTGVKQGTVYLVVAGGGGGAGMGGTNGVGGAITTTGNPSSTGLVLGGTAGGGGAAFPSNGGGTGGGGLLSAGADNVGTSNTPGLGGFGATGGSASNQCAGLSGVGGFGAGGGGGGESQRGGAGGGGGYSGGGGGEWSTIGWCAGGVGFGGGGGGSFNAGANQVNTGSVNIGHGQVVVTELCNISMSVSVTNSLNAICSGNSVTLTTNAVNNYVWSTGANTSSLIVTPSVTTVYTLSATSFSGCTGYASTTVIVNAGQPTLSINSSTNQVCLGRTVTLTASGAVSYSWTGGISNGVSFQPSATSSYTVTGANGCGVATGVTSVTVTALPVNLVATSTAVCINRTATLTASAAATSYTWLPIGVVNTFSTMIVNPSVTTVYTVTASDGTCSGVSSFSLQANPIPVIGCSVGSNLICPGDLAGLHASGGLSYTWSPGNLFGNNVVVSPTVTTLYTVTGENSFGCFNYATLVLSVGAKPNIVLSASSTTICSGASATLTASGANTYTWDNGSNGTVNIVSPTQTTVFTVVGTNTAQCADTKTVEITVFSPTLGVAGPTSICAGQAANLVASGANSYTWDPGHFTFPAYQHAPLSTTIYTVTAITNTNNVLCPLAGTIEVLVNPSPTISTSDTKTATCVRSSNTVNATGALTYSWVAGTTTANGASAVFSWNFASVLLYTVTGTNAFGCEASFSGGLVFSPCTEIDELEDLRLELSVYPNPNAGEFLIQGRREQELTIINPLGQAVQKVQILEANGFLCQVVGLKEGLYMIVGDRVLKKIIVSR